MPDNGSLPLIGYPGAGFHAIHITALISIFASIGASVSVICYMFRFCRNEISFYKWHLGERLVIYLALIDIGWGLNHGIDHIIIYATKTHPVRELCVFFGFALQFFMTVQSLLVMFAAGNAFFLMVKQKRVRLGRRDWKLLLFCFLPPLVLGSILAGLGYLGQNGAWCHVDMRRVPEGFIVYTIYATMVLAVFVVNSICYASVGITLKRSYDRVAKYEASQQAHLHRLIATCRSLILIVAAYIFQWWPFVVLTIWSYISEPHIVFFVIVVTFCNAGGIFNSVAYTVMKRRKHCNFKQSLQNSQQRENDSQPTDNNNSNNFQLQRF